MFLLHTVVYLLVALPRELHTVSLIEMSLKFVNISGSDESQFVTALMLYCLSYYFFLCGSRAWKQGYDFASYLQHTYIAPETKSTLLG